MRIESLAHLDYNGRGNRAENQEKGKKLGNLNCGYCQRTHEAVYCAEPAVKTVTHHLFDVFNITDYFCLQRTGVCGLIETNTHLLHPLN